MMKELVISALHGTIGIVLGILVFALFFFIDLVFQCRED